MGWLSRLCYRLVWVLSGEFLLQWPTRRANGGTIIFFRATIVTVIVYSGAIVLSELLDPSSQWKFSSAALRLTIKSTLPWFAAIFAGSYAALYSRFASQWSYLASLYNQIKIAEAQATVTSADAVTSMKAGFIEDAEELHLALKQMYAALIKNWSADSAVRAEFVSYAPGGQARLDLLLADVNHAVEQYERHYAKRTTRRLRK